MSFQSCGCRVLLAGMPVFLWPARYWTSHHLSGLTMWICLLEVSSGFDLVPPAQTVRPDKLLACMWLWSWGVHLQMHMHDFQQAAAR